MCAGCRGDAARPRSTIAWPRPAGAATCAPPWPARPVAWPSRARCALPLRRPAWSWPSWSREIDDLRAGNRTARTASAGLCRRTWGCILTGLSCNELVEIGNRDHLARAFATVAGSEVAQPARLDVALERLDRAAELGRRLRHGERVIGPAHALLTRCPLDRPAFLDANRPVVGAELVVDDVLLLGRIVAHGPPRRILLCGGRVIGALRRRRVIKPWRCRRTTSAGWGVHLYGTGGVRCRTANQPPEIKAAQGSAAESPPTFPYALADVRFAPESGHQPTREACPFRANSVINPAQ